jgi:hypothetical protein
MRMEEPGKYWNSLGEALKIWLYEVHDEDDDDDNGGGGGGGCDIWDSGNSVSVTIVIASFIV